MYNEEQKLRFMDAVGMTKTNYRWAVAMFESVAAMEAELGKDLSEMDAAEVGMALATSDVISSNTLSNRIPLVVRYKTWCADNGFHAVQVTSDQIDVDVSEGIRNTMVSSPKVLLAILNKAFKENSEKDSKCIYKAFLWMGFAGMQDLDTVKVRDVDVDFREGFIFYENRWYSLPKEAIRDVKHAAELDALTRIVNGQIRTFRRAEGNRILRGRMLTREISDKNYLMKTLRTAVGYGFNQIGRPGMSFARIRKSGIFYEMFRRETKGVPVNFYQVGYDDFIFEGKKATPGQTKQKILRRIILGYEKDYAAWKRAFADDLKNDFGLSELPASPKD